MKAKEFIEGKGIPVDDNVRFVLAGNTVVIPLFELLEEFAGLNVKPVATPVKSLKKK